MPAAPIILGAAAAAGVASTIGTAIVASITTATISASVATAIGTGVIAGGLTAIQGGSSSDILKSAVLSGVGSYVGGQVASKVTSTVAANTGASLVDLEPALRELSKEGITAGGVAAITAGNVAGQSVNAAITGRPIEDAALLGLATSIPTALTASKDFQSLDKVAQNVIASSLQASALGSDVGTAAISSLVASSEIVAKAIKEIPNGEAFIEQNPIFAKYIVDSVSSALVAKLAGADVSESVIASLARTTGDVLAREFQNAQNSQSVTEARQKNDEATRLQQQAVMARDELTQLLATNKRDVDNLNNLLEAYPRNKEIYEQTLRRYNSAVGDYDRLNYDETFKNYITQRASVEGLSPEQFIAREANSLVPQLETYAFQLDNSIKNLNSTTEKLQNNGFFDNYDRLVNNIKTYDSQYTALVRDVNVLAENLSSTSESLFNDFSNELETTLAPLTAFQDETVPDQDILAEIQPVTPPEELLAGGDASQVTIVNPQIAQEIQSKQQEIENINKEAVKMAFAGVDVAAFPALAVSVGGHAALAAYIWLSQKYNELFPDPETAKIALEQSQQAQQFVTIIKMELNKTPEVKITTNPVTQKREAKVTVPDTPENPLLKETKEFIERIEAEIKTPSEAAKFNADNVYNELVKIFEEKGVDGGTGTSSDTVAGGGGGDIAADIESIISGEGLVPEDVTEVVTDTTLPSDVQLPIVVTPTVAGGTAGGETIPQTPIGEVTDQEIKDVIDQQTPTVIGGEGETPITPTLPGGEQETTVGGGEAPTTVSGGETPTTVAGGEAETTVTGGEAPTTVETITGGDVAETGQASVPGGEISDEEIINIIVGEGNVPPSGELPATTVVGGEEAPTTVVGGEDTIPGGLPEETITGEAGADTVVGGGDQVVEIAPTIPGGEQITPTISGGEEITPTIPGGEGEISDEDLINIIIGEGTPTTAGGGGEDTVVGGEEIPTVPGGEQVLPTVPGGDVTDILQPTLPEGVGEGDTVVSGGGEADTVLGGGGEGEATLPGGEGEDTVGGGLGDGEITDQDIINIITGGDTGVGGGGEDTTLAGGGGDEVTPTIPGGDDEAILDLIRDLEQEEGMEEIPLDEEEPIVFDEEGMEEIPLEPDRGVRPALTVVPRQRTFQRPGEAAPYRVTGQDESGILGRKQPLFGGDEDLQRAEWNRRSLRLKRLLGL